MDSRTPTTMTPTTPDQSPAATPTESQRLTLSSLPNEILDRIFSLLPVPDTRLCRLISHRFLPSATRASFPILVVSPLFSDAEHLQHLAKSPDIAPSVKSFYYVTDTLAEPRWHTDFEISPTPNEGAATEEPAGEEAPLEETATEEPATASVEEVAAQEPSPTVVQEIAPEQVAPVGPSTTPNQEVAPETTTEEPSTTPNQETAPEAIAPEAVAPDETASTTSSEESEIIYPDAYVWNAHEHPRNWLPHYVHHPHASGTISVLSPDWYQYRYRPLFAGLRRGREQIAVDRERYEEILLDQAKLVAADGSLNRDHDGIVNCLEKFPALENITIAACRELSLAAPLNSVPLHSDRNPFRYAPWRTAFPSISTPETEERVMRSLVEYLENQSVQGRSYLKTLRIKNLSWSVLERPGLFFTPIMTPALGNLTTLEIQIRHGNPIHVAATECIPGMSQERLSQIMSTGRVREFLKSLTNLRHLTFERDRVWYPDDQIPTGHYYRWSLGDVIDPDFQWPRLQSLSLSYFDNCEREDIERIMANHADTLWKVSLGHATLRTTSWVNLVDYFYQENQNRIAGYDSRPLYHLELWGVLRGTREKDITGRPNATDHAGESERWIFWRGETQSWELARYVYGIAFQVSLYAREQKPLYARVLAGQSEEGIGGLEG